MILATLLLLSGLSISVVAIYYSVMGLMAIFSAAAIPIAIMGVSLEVGKLVTASWVKAHWHRLPLLMKTYAVAAVAILMVITSLGIFGYLSKAHSDQTLVSGDVQAKVAIYDERIKTEKDNIEADRKQIAQMDAAVDQVLSRSDDEKGASKANEIRRSQLRDRSRLQNEILASQKKIATIQDERAPFAAENRKVEAEVGPIKYIAAFVYGANPDANILERAVTWVIILIVIVFDPLAVVMLLASQMTFQWHREEKQAKYEQDEGSLTVDQIEQIKSREVPELTPGQTELYSETFPTLDEAVERAREEDYGDCPKCGTKLSNAPGIGSFCPNKECDVVDGVNLPEHQPGYVELTPFTVTDTANLNSAVDVVKTMLPDPEIQQLRDRIVLVEQDRNDLIEFVKQNQEDYNTITGLHNRSMQREITLQAEVDKLNSQLNQVYEELAEKEQPINITPVETVSITVTDTPPVITPEQEPKPVTEELELVEEQPIVQPIEELPEAPPQESEPVPEVVAPEPVAATGYITDPIEQIFIHPITPPTRKPNADFGNVFPDNPIRGDMCLRTDFKPSRLFKWNSQKWLEINKNTTDAYSYNDSYIQFLAEKLFSGEYTLDDLTEVEQTQIQTLMGGRHG